MIRTMYLPMSSTRWLRLSLVTALFLLMGCVNRELTSSTAGVTSTLSPIPAAATIVPLVATFTPLPGILPAATPESTRGDSPASPVGETATPVSFEEIIVDLQYVVPALGLDRRLKGDMANRITLVDHTTGVEAEYRNQGGVLLELRQALSSVTLGAVPEGCQRCVYIEYTLSIEEEAAAGWLQDLVLLASIENYMAVALGPYFPQDTLVALRRSASPYSPAHTIALTADGELWKWLAIDKEIPPPTSSITSTTPLSQLSAQLADASLDESYVMSCEGSPVETLFVNSGGEARSVSIVCPEYSLPSILLPLYLQLETELQTILADVSLPRPPAAFPLTAILDYRRADGRRLTLYQDGRALAVALDAVTYTRTLTSTQLVSITNDLLDSGELQAGLNTFFVDSSETITSTSSGSTPEPTSVLVLRGPDGFYDGEWNVGEGVDALTELNKLLDEMVGIIPFPSVPSAGTSTPVATETVQGGIILTATAVATPDSTPTPRP